MMARLLTLLFTEHGDGVVLKSGRIELVDDATKLINHADESTLPRVRPGSLESLSECHVDLESSACTELMSCQR